MMMKHIFLKLGLLLLCFPSRCCMGWLLDNLHEHCGVEHVSSLDAAIDQARMHRITTHNNNDNRDLQKLSCNQLCDGCIPVDVVFHYFVFTFRGTTVLPHPTEAMQRYDAGDTSLQISDFTTPAAFLQNLRNQITVTNAHLQGTPFRLRLADPAYTTTNNNSYMRYPVDSFQEITATVGSGNLRVLDVYLSYNVLRLAETNPFARVGLATLPSQQLLRKGDGIFLRYDVVAGGGFGGGVDLGVTLTHEFGHWMGLYHTFRTQDGSEFGCEASPNDFVDDTPAHEGNSMFYDCRAYLSTNFLQQPLPDTCTGLPGRDPVLNYMNYVSADECLMQEGEFTCGQIQRMYYQWSFYRDEVLACPQGEMAIAWAYEFDREHDEENRVFLYRLQGNGRLVIFDSDIDHDDGAFRAQGVLAVDVCVPQNSDYIFEIQDSAGDGFSNRGEVEVLRDGERVASGTGNWGSTFTVTIPALTPPPTSKPTQAPVTSTPSSAPTTDLPTAAPITPTASPTDQPSTNQVSTDSPTKPPTPLPTFPPTLSPTSRPTLPPTSSPTSSPTLSPASSPTLSPTSSPVAPPPIMTSPPTSPPTKSPISSTARPSEDMGLRSEPPVSVLTSRPTMLPSPMEGGAVGVTTQLPTSLPKLITTMKTKMSHGMEKLGKSYRPPTKGSAYPSSSNKSSSKMSKASKEQESKKKSRKPMESRSMKMESISSSSSVKKSEGSKKVEEKVSPTPSAPPTGEHDIFDM